MVQVVVARRFVELVVEIEKDQQRGLVVEEYLEHGEQGAAPEPGDYEHVVEVGPAEDVIVPAEQDHGSLVVLAERIHVYQASVVEH